MQPVHWRDFIPATVGKWKLFAHTHWCRQTDRVTVLSAFVKSIFFKRESKSVCIWKSSIKPSRLSFIFKTLHSLIPDFFRTINYKVQLFWLNPYRRSPKTWMKCRFYRVRKSGMSVLGIFRSWCHTSTQLQRRHCLVIKSNVHSFCDKKNCCLCARTKAAVVPHCCNRTCF